jgi:hypothetical protein
MIDEEFKSNISIRSNLILDDEEYKPIYKFIPGDYVGEIYPELVDRRNITNDLSKSQQIEHEQYLVCLLCNSPCAGTCQKNYSNF